MYFLGGAQFSTKAIEYGFDVWIYQQSFLLLIVTLIDTNIIIGHPKGDILALFP